jgi:hypothetical protein
MAAIHFKNFLINENKYYLGQKVGDILSALQSLSEDAPNLGNRALIRASQGIINQIRRVVHGRWDDEDLNSLKSLQKVGVAICKAIDEKSDMSGILAGAVAVIEKITQDSEVPVNDLASDQDADEEESPENGLAPENIGA